MAISTRDSEGRPDPDALLALAQKDRRGRLKIFLGAAPGVGKTYAMLQNAQRLKAEGVDVAIGLVETHGRAETLALTGGLEILPKRQTEYRGRTIEEFDLDAALKRRPKLLVLDELAHTNAPDCRHPKRWQDAEELLDAGIDVWTAMNVQHVESLADVVSRITGVVVRETVPDTVLQAADAIVLVDITPEELITRLNEGKVYVPETARRATQNFFTVGNLTALRELALRRTADRVDDEMVDYLRQKAIEGPWATAERLLACVGPDAASETVVRTTARLATGLNAPWIVAYAESLAEQDQTDAGKKIDDLFRLAERLGAETRRLSGPDVVGQILQLARAENVTQIIIGGSRPSLWKRLSGRSLVDAMLARAEDIGVQVIPSAPARGAFVRPSLNGIKSASFFADLAAACVTVAIAVGVGELLTLWLALPNLSMIFLAAVLACAATLGLRAAVMASLVSFLAYNFFFIEPIYTFTIAEPHELFALLIFLAVAILTGSLAGRVRDQSAASWRRVESTQALFDYSRKLAGASNLDEVLWVAAAHIRHTIAERAWFLFPEDGLLRLTVAWPPEDKMEPGESSAANWAFEKGEPAGWRTGTLPTIPMQFRPLATTRGVIGVCGVEPRNRDEPFTAEEERSLAAILEQTAIAADRALLVGSTVKAAALEQNEKIRATLLSSLSHDLRTPLAAITGAATSLRQLGPNMSSADNDDLLRTIDEEATRLTGFVSNLLDMSRIESGALAVKRDWVDIADVIRSAADRARKVFPDQPTTISIEPNLPFMRGDSNLLSQVIFNLLDNAHKYGGEPGATIHARREGDQIAISVTDDGPGVKKADLEKIFEKFYRGGRVDGRRAGTGLGLSICKGIVEAMGGTIVAQSPAVRRRGTRIVMRFPVAIPPATKGESD